MTLLGLQPARLISKSTSGVLLNRVLGIKIVQEPVSIRIVQEPETSGTGQHQDCPGTGDEVQRCLTPDTNRTLALDPHVLVPASPSTICNFHGNTGTHVSEPEQRALTHLACVSVLAECVRVAKDKQSLAQRVCGSSAMARCVTKMTKCDEEQGP